MAKNFVGWQSFRDWMFRLDSIPELEFSCSKDEIESAEVSPLHLRGASFPNLRRLFMRPSFCRHARLLIVDVDRLPAGAAAERAAQS